MTKASRTSPGPVAAVDAISLLEEPLRQPRERGNRPGAKQPRVIAGHPALILDQAEIDQGAGRKFDPDRARPVHREIGVLHVALLVEAYGIKLAPEPEYTPPKHALWAWLVTGYSECIDSFFAFGLFETARRSGYFPDELVETFEPVIQEEARHILFFANWVAWRRRNLPLWERPIFRLTEWAVWAFLIWERIGIARGLDKEGEMQDANFAMNGAGASGRASPFPAISR